MIRFTWAALFSIVFCTVTSNLAQAAASYSLTFGQPTYQITLGNPNPTPIDVYLVEQLGPSDSSLVNTNDGLYIVTVSVTRDSSNATQAAYFDTVPPNWSWNPGFDDGAPETAETLSFTSGGTVANVSLAQGTASSGPMIDEDSDNDLVPDRVYLFTLYVYGGSLGETVLSVSMSDGILLFTGEELSPESSATTIEVIPEPATVLLAVTGLLLLTSRRPRNPGSVILGMSRKAASPPHR